MLKQKMAAKDAAFYSVSYLIFGLFTLLCIFPFYYIFINSISGNDLSRFGQILFYPKDIHFGNYIEILKLRGLGQAAWVSVARTVVGTVSCVLCTAFVAFILSRKELMFRKALYRYFIVTMYLNVGIIAWYINMNMLGLTNNFLAYVIGVVNPFNLVLAKTFIESLPTPVFESAEIDGAGTMTVFVRLIIPLSKPILATTAVFTAVNQWNAFMDTYILMTDSKLYTLQYMLYEFLNKNKFPPIDTSGIFDPSRVMTSTSMKMTISMVVVLPILFVYPFFQRYFVKGILLGAVKG
ncbi:MAG: carbohydrate ABC transporter permease [Oscillospiraceae bacterium]|nr:carbohydrate ABC transporter permease [Oscillospiraceae bacterium]